MIKRNIIILPAFIFLLSSFFSVEASIPPSGFLKCEESTITVSGKVVSPNGKPIKNAEVCLNANLIEFPHCTSTDENGFYSFNSIPSGYVYELFGYDATKYTKNVTSLDYVLVIRHMLGLEEHLDHPYKIIAADTNADNKLTSLDLKPYRDVILGVLPKFPQTETIRYVNADYDFPDVKNPWPDENGNPFIIKFKPTQDVTFGFVGIRIGNVSQN